MTNIQVYYNGNDNFFHQIEKFDYIENNFANDILEGRDKIKIIIPNFSINSKVMTFRINKDELMFYTPILKLDSLEGDIKTNKYHVSYKCTEENDTYKFQRLWIYIAKS